MPRDVFQKHTEKDKLEGENRFVSNYTLQEVEDFENYIERQLSKVDDIPNVSSEDMQYMRDMMLTMYANPLKNKLLADCC